MKKQYLELLQGRLGNVGSPSLQVTDLQYSSPALFGTGIRALVYLSLNTSIRHRDFLTHVLLFVVPSQILRYRPKFTALEDVGNYKFAQLVWRKEQESVGDQSALEIRNSTLKYWQSREGKFDHSILQEACLQYSSLPHCGTGIPTRHNVCLAFSKGQ